MTLTISDTAMTSDRSHCTARHSPDRNGWEVSWLPGQLLDRNTAITAMTLADTAAEHDLHDRHPLLPHVESWAEELGLTAPEAIARASQPPSVIDRRARASQPAAQPRGSRLNSQAQQRSGQDSPRHRSAARPVGRFARSAG